MTTTLRILVVDDHPTFALGMLAILRSRWPSATLDHASCLDRARSALRGAWDLVVLDHGLGIRDGLDLVPEALEGGAKVVVVSMADSPADRERARVRGALGWLRKDCAPESLLDSIAAVLEGGVLWDRGGVRLSPRERSVLEGIAQRVPLKRLAARLGISYSTLNTYRRRISRKLDLGDDSDP